MKNNLANMLKQERKKKNITQTELAKILNVSQRAYSNYERGDVEPSIDTLINMADYFGMPIDLLVGRYELRKNN